MFSDLTPTLPRVMGNQKLPNGAAFPGFEVRVARSEKAPGTLPQRSSTVVRYRPEDAVNFRRPQVFNITMGMMEWGINGRSFELDLPAIGTFTLAMNPYAPI